MPKLKKKKAIGYRPKYHYAKKNDHIDSNVPPAPESSLVQDTRVISPYVSPGKTTDEVVPLVSPCEPPTKTTDVDVLSPTKTTDEDVLLTCESPTKTTDEDVLLTCESPTETTDEDVLLTCESPTKTTDEDVLLTCESPTKTTDDHEDVLLTCESPTKTTDEDVLASCRTTFQDHSYVSLSGRDQSFNSLDHDDHDYYNRVPEVDLSGEDPPEERSGFETLKANVKNNLGSPFVSVIREEEIEVLELYKSAGKTSVKLLVIFDEKFTASIYVHRKKISNSHVLWNDLPSSFNTFPKVLQLLHRLQKFSVCIGNPDEEFHDLTPIGSGLTTGNSAEIHAYREGDFCAQLGDLTYHSTIRATGCTFLVEGRRCSNCSSYRRCLRARKQRLSEQVQLSATKDLISSKYKHCDMSRHMLISKIKQQQTCIRSLQHTIDRQRRDIDRQILQCGISVPDHQNQEMSDLVQICKEDMEKAFPDPNSLQRLLWEQQLKFVRSGKNGMRWHPMIIKWCLYLRHKSAKAYDVLRDSGFVNLPSARTLFDYSHYTTSALGFQGDVIKVLQEEASKKGMFSPDEQYKCYVGLLFDEIKIKEDLVYDKHTGELVGYCNLDKVGNQILELQKLSNDSSATAKYMLVLMVRGVSTDLKFPLAGFATTSITADFLYPIIWKAVDIVEMINLKVLFLTCDGASSNRKFFEMHRVSEDQVLVHSTVNPRDKSRKIFFISDVPHLMKTTRNCFSNSFSHKNTRKLWRNGKDISWLHILKLYEEHCELSLYSPCPKLTRAHVDMTSFGCMKVNLAVQVLSSSVANALEELYDDAVSETVEFVRHFNKFFDCLNVRSLFEGRNKRNPDLNPYKEVADARLDWLKTDFLGYLDQWNTCVENRPGDFSQAQRNNMKLSRQTLEGLKISVNSITECVKIMLNAGANFVLTHHFNQDPIEQHFGHYRNRCGNNSNPTVYEVRNMMTSMRAIGAQALVPRNGNVHCGNQENVLQPIDNSKLPKRKRKS